LLKRVSDSNVLKIEFLDVDGARLGTVECELLDVTDFFGIAVAFVQLVLPRLRVDLAANKLHPRYHTLPRFPLALLLKGLQLLFYTFAVHVVLVLVAQVDEPLDADVVCVRVAIAAHHIC
jgi:hypothetical protein